MSYYNYSTPIFAFESDFELPNAEQWMKTNWFHSITLSFVYLALIYAGERIMSRRKALSLEQPLLYWNGLLAAFSVAGFLRMTPEFFEAVFTKGFQYSVCDSSYASGLTGFWTFAFTLSKAFELIDTFFIVLRKRPLIFLHVYHHVTVMIYSWHAYKDLTAAGRWFVWMNYTVHSLMYTYYASRTWGLRFPKWVPLLVTTLQLTQMIGGCVVAVTVYQVKTAGQPCIQTWENLYFSLAIYLSYFALFAKFFYDTYLKKGSRYKINVIDVNVDKKVS